MKLRAIDAMRAWQPARTKHLPIADHARVLSAARIARHDGLTALYLAGTPYEMGYQHGVLARDLIHGFRQAAYDYVNSQLPVPRWLARPLLFFHSAAYWPTIPAGLTQEMRGIADGAGVHPIEVLVSTAIWEMFLVSGCSEFAAVGPVTADGTLLHGYNYDLMRPEHALIQPYLAAICYRPSTGLQSQGLPFFTVNTVGSVGANAGMNAAGISVAWDNTNLRDDELTRGIGLPMVPFIITLRRLLQGAQTLDEAIRTVAGSLPRSLGDIIVIGSAHERRAVALETAGRLHAVREMQDGVVWSTNCFRSPELAPHDRRGDGRGLVEDAAWQHFPRYTAYSHLFEAHRGQLTPAIAADFLRDPYPREAAGFVHPHPAARATICRDITSWSLVMEPGKGRFWVSDTEVPGCQGRFFAFDLAQWQRLPELDLAPSGYQAALRAAQRFIGGDLAGAHAALEEASVHDGPSAPLLLLRAVVHGLAGEDSRAAEVLVQLQARWPQSAAGALARNWLDGPPVEGTARIPFPSAIRPLIHLQPGANWQDRASVEAPPAAAGASPSP